MKATKKFRPKKKHHWMSHYQIFVKERGLVASGNLFVSNYQQIITPDDIHLMEKYITEQNEELKGDFSVVITNISYLGYFSPSIKETLKV